MKCGNIFWKIRKLQFSSVLHVQSIMTARLLNNKRGKKTLICGEIYIYSTLNKQGVSQYWRCLEYVRKNCSAMAKTFIDGKDILNLPEHSHSSDIAQINFLLAECDALNKYVYRANDVLCNRSIFV